MSHLADSLRAALNAARKSQEKARALVLSTILANLKNRELELARDPTDAEVVEVIRKGIKLRREAAEQFTAAQRADLAGVEQKLLVTLPRQTPLSGVYDFVVFSECSIVKGGSISCP